MSRLKKAKEKRGAIYANIEKLRKETDSREMTAEERTSWEQMTNDYATADQEVRDAERFEQIEMRQMENRENPTPPNTGAGSDNNADAEQRAAFIQYLATGDAESRASLAPSPETRAALAGLAGGVIVPQLLANSIERALLSYGGMLEASTIVRTETGAKLILPTINDTSSKAIIVAEYAQSTKNKPQFSSVELGAYTYRTPIVPISLELLQDSAFNVEQVISDLLGESFGRGLNEHLTTGTGTGQPKGIVTAAKAIAQKAAIDAIAFEDLLALMSGVNSAYAKHGKFMFSRATLFELMKIKGTDGRYIWNESISKSVAPTIFGHEYVVNDDMASIGAGAASVIFGDLSKYRVRIVRNFAVTRLNELYAEWLSIGMMGFARADGVLLDAGTNPVVKLVHANS